MTMDGVDCPKCRTSMEEGFIKDEGYGTVQASKWVEGAPEKSFWTRSHLESYAWR